MSTRSAALVLSLVVVPLAACGAKTDSVAVSGELGAGGSSVTLGAGAAGIGAAGAKHAAGAPPAAPTTSVGVPKKHDCGPEGPCPDQICAPCADGSQSCVPVICVSTPTDQCVHGSFHCPAAGDVVAQLYSPPSDPACVACLRSMAGPLNPDDPNSMDCTDVIAACGPNDEQCAPLVTCMASQIGPASLNASCAFYACAAACPSCNYAAGADPASQFMFCALGLCTKACHLDPSVCGQ